MWRALCRLSIIQLSRDSLAVTGHARVAFQQIASASTASSGARDSFGALTEHLSNISGGGNAHDPDSSRLTPHGAGAAINAGRRHQRSLAATVVEQVRTDHAPASQRCLPVYARGSRDERRAGARLYAAQTDYEGFAQHALSL